MKPPVALRLDGIHKSFGSSPVLKGITFEVSEGEIIALLGPSGCGKSTLLSIVAGLEDASQGDVIWYGEKINHRASHLRGFGLMFQDYILFPHMNVQRNVAFGLEMAHAGDREVEERVQETLRLVGLSGYGERDVNSLSGGEQQRVALARALAPRPDLLMLDEPLGSIDRTLRERLIEDLHHILHELKQTAIYVTHDQEEAFIIADRVVLMRAGLIEQIDTPQELYRTPATRFAARFLGMTNLIPGDAYQKDGRTYVNTSIGSFPIGRSLNGEVTLLVRPESANLEGRGEVELSGKVIRKTFRGNVCQLTIQIGEEMLGFNFLSNIDLPGVGQPVKISFVPHETLIAYQDPET